MERLRTISIWLAGKLNYVSGICIVAMMTLSCFDIILRFFRMPIPGTYEIVSFLSAIMISFAMAQTTLDRGHVAVEFIVTRLSRRLQTAAFIFINCIILILLMILSFETARYGVFFKESEELSLTLQLPFYPILYGMAFGFAVACLIPLVDIISVLVRDQEPWYQWK